MNFTTLSLSLLWASQFYCICSNSSVDVCLDECQGLGPMINYHQDSIIRSIKNNPNPNITFTLVGFDSNEFSETLFLNNSIFKRKNYKENFVTFRSKSDDFQYVNLSIDSQLDLLNLKFEKIHLTISQNMESSTSTFGSLILINSILDYKNDFSVTFDYFKLDYNSLVHLFIKNRNNLKFHKLEINSFDDENTTIKKISFNSYLLSLKIGLFNISINLRYSECQKIKIDFDKSDEDNEEEFYISFDLYKSKIPLEVDFSKINKIINMTIFKHDQTNIADILLIRLGRNTLEMHSNPRSDDSSQIDTPLESEIADLFEPPTYSHKTTSEFLFEPFFYIDGEGDFFYDNAKFSLQNFFSIFDQTNIDYFFEEIKLSCSPTITININTELDQLFIPSHINNRSFSIISNSSHTKTKLVFENSMFPKDKYQEFYNIAIVDDLQELSPSLSQYEEISNENLDHPNIAETNNNYEIYENYLNFSHLTFINSTCDNIFLDYLTLTTDIASFLSINYSFSIKQEIILIARDENNLCINSNGMLEFSSGEVNIDCTNQLTLILNGDLSLHYHHFLFLNKLNLDIYQDSTIYLYEFLNHGDELTKIFIKSNLCHVDVLSDSSFPVPNPIKIIDGLNVSFNSINILLSPEYCVCHDQFDIYYTDNEIYDDNYIGSSTPHSENNCNHFCLDEYGPIIPFSQKIISTTIALLSVDYVNYTVINFQNSNNLKPCFEYANYISTNFSIRSGTENPAYISFQVLDNFLPSEQQFSSFQNLEIYILTQNANPINIHFNEVYLKSILFIFEEETEIFMHASSFNSDVFTLFNFPNDLHLFSPTTYCSILCGDIIPSVVLCKNGIIFYNEDNATYQLNLTSLSTITRIYSEYGLFEHDPFVIMLDDPQPTSLTDILDLVFDVSQTNSSEVFISFPDQWNSKIEDVSSKIEIYHAEKTLYISGKIVDYVYTSTPPTIFHNGAGDLYINGVLSTFRTKYCICFENFTEGCDQLCADVGPIISFDQESITSTVKSNPTRHISYLIYGSTSEMRPYFRLDDFSVKSFTLSGDPTIQFIDLEPTNYTPEVPLNHRFNHISIRLLYNHSEYKFYNLEIQSSCIEPCTDCLVTQIGLIIDIESAYSLFSQQMLTSFQTFSLIGKYSLSKIVFSSMSTITAHGFNNSYLVNFDIGKLIEPISISTLIGSTNQTLLSFELPEYDIDYDSIPELNIDLTQVSKSKCYLLFPSSRWTNLLSNLTQKINVQYGRQDFYEESSKINDEYEGTPPLVNCIGTGDYYINGVLADGPMPKPTSTPTDKSFKSIGPSEIAGIIIGSIIFIIVVVGIIIYFIKKRVKYKHEQSEFSPSRELFLIDNEEI